MRTKFRKRQKYEFVAGGNSLVYPSGKTVAEVRAEVKAAARAEGLRAYSTFQEGYRVKFYNIKSSDKTVLRAIRAVRKIPELESEDNSSTSQAKSLTFYIYRFVGKSGKYKKSNYGGYPANTKIKRVCRIIAG